MENYIVDLVNEQKYQDALILISKELKHKPQSFVLKKLQGIALLGLIEDEKNPTAKAELTNQAIDSLMSSWEGMIDSQKQEQENQDCLIFLADAFLTKGDPDQAIVFICKCLDFNFQIVDCYYRLGRAKQKQENWVDAINAYTLAISNKHCQINFNNWGALHTNKGICHYNMKCEAQLESANLELLEGIQVQPDFAPNYTNLAIVMERRGQLKEAIGILDKAKAIFPKDARILIAKGNLQRNMKDYPAALKTYDEASKLDPTNLDVMLEKANLQFQQQKFDDAFKAYTVILTSRPDHTSALNNMGLCCMELKKDKEAKEYFAKVLAKDPNEKDTMINLAAVLNRTGDGKGAIEMYQKAITIDKRSSHAYNGLGIALKGQKQLKEAAEAFDNAITNDSKYILAYVNKAQVLQLEGNQAEALANLQKAQQLLGDPMVQKSLNSELTKFIDGSLKKIVELEQHELYHLENKTHASGQVQTKAAFQSISTLQQQQTSQTIEQALTYPDQYIAAKPQQQSSGKQQYPQKQQQQGSSTQKLEQQKPVAKVEVLCGSASCVLM